MDMDTFVVAEEVMIRCLENVAFMGIAKVLIERIK